MSTPPPISSTTIDDLPEPLLIHILSLLYIKDAIQTSLLSSKFRNLWHSIPSLKFDVAEYYARIKSPYPHNHRRTHNALRNFAEFVYQTLFVRKRNPLTKFALTFEIPEYGQMLPRYEHYVQHWVLYAIGLSVTELVLDFDYRNIRWEQIDDESYGEWSYTGFGLCLLDLRGSCVEVLKLNKCGIMFPPKSNPVKFVYLKSVELCWPMWLTEEDVCDLVARCVNLETLKLMDTDDYGPTGDLVIYSASIKEVYLEDIGGTGLDIRCPTLQKISLIRSEYDKYTIKDTTMLVEAHLLLDGNFKHNIKWEILLSFFTNVSSLSVWDELLESDGVPAGYEQYASNVKHLELYCAYKKDDLVTLAALLKLLPNLEVLVLHGKGVGYYSDRATKDVKLHKDYCCATTVFKMPRVKKVILRKYQKTIGERDFVKLFRKNGVVLEKIKLLRN